MLALRSRGLGSVITTVTLYYREEVAALLGIPEGYAQSCMLPVAYYTGDDFKPAVRRPLEEVCFVNRWGWVADGRLAHGWVADGRLSGPDPPAGMVGRGGQNSER